MRILRDPVIPQATDSPSGNTAGHLHTGSTAVSRGVFSRMRLILWVADTLTAVAGLAAAFLLDRPNAGVTAVLWLTMLVMRTSRDGRLADLSDMRPFVKTNVKFVLFMTLTAIMFSDLYGIRAVLALAASMAILGFGSRVLLDLPSVRRLLHVDSGESVIVVGDLRSVSRTIAEWEGVRTFNIVGVCLSAADLGPSYVKDVPVLGSVSDIADITRRLKIDVVAVHDVDALGGLQLAKLQWALEDVGTQLSIITPMTNTVIERARVRTVGRRLIVDIAYNRPQGVTACIKHLIDRFVALMLVIAAAPAMLVCAVLIKLSSPGPVFFKQTRVREHGKTFTMYKLRTMAVDAEDRLKELLEHNEVGGGLFKMKADPRITGVGRWMRRLSLDELPQLWNVVVGDMSLVGPRPALPHEVATYDQFARRRLAVKPGLTGLWQVSGRSNLSWEETVRIDSDYVDNWRPARDLAIAFRTFKAVLSKDGAH